MADPKKGVNVQHNSGSDGFHVTRWQNSGGSDRGTRESSDYRSSGGGWNRDDSSTHSTDQNYDKGDPNRHG